VPQRSGRRRRERKWVTNGESWREKKTSRIKNLEPGGERKLGITVLSVGDNVTAGLWYGGGRRGLVDGSALGKCPRKGGAKIRSLDCWQKISGRQKTLWSGEWEKTKGSRTLRTKNQDQSSSQKGCWGTLFGGLYLARWKSSQLRGGRGKSSLRNVRHMRQGEAESLRSSRQVTYRERSQAAKELSVIRKGGWSKNERSFRKLEQP